MLRSGRLVGLDRAAAELAAVGLVRLAIAGDGAKGGLGRRIRASAFADTWLAFGEPAAPELRVPAEEVLRALVGWSAQLVLAVHLGEEADALESLGRQAGEAAERARQAQAAHPAEPTACTLLWHAVQELAADGEPEHRRRIEDRCEAYVRDRHRRLDTLALILACARLAADAVLELADGDPARAHGRLAEHASRAMPLAARVPLWVPGRPTA